MGYVVVLPPEIGIGTYAGLIGVEIWSNTGPIWSLKGDPREGKFSDLLFRAFYKQRRTRCFPLKIEICIISVVTEYFF